MSTEKVIKNLVDRFVADIIAISRRAQSESRATALRAIESRLREESPRKAAPAAAPKKKTTARRGAPAPTQAARPSSPTARGRAARSTSAAPSAPASKRGSALANTAASAPAPKSHRANGANGRSSTNGVAEHAGRASSPPARRTRTRESLVEKKPRAKAQTNGHASSAGFDAEAALRAEEEAKAAEGGAGPTNSEREATVLDAVRFLVRATAGEIAQRCGLPNGTVYVVLRALVTNDQVAKTATARGIEYSLVSSGGIRPFKRANASTGQTEPPPPPAGASTSEAPAQTAAAGASN